MLPGQQPHSDRPEGFKFPTKETRDQRARVARRLNQVRTPYNGRMSFEMHGKTHTSFAIDIIFILYGIYCMYMISILSQPNKNDGNGDIVIAASFSYSGPGKKPARGVPERRERESVIGQLCPA